MGFIIHICLNIYAPKHWSSTLSLCAKLSNHRKELFMFWIEFPVHLKLAVQNKKSFNVYSFLSSIWLKCALFIDNIMKYTDYLCLTNCLISTVFRRINNTFYRRTVCRCQRKLQKIIGCKTTNILRQVDEVMSYSCDELRH